VLLLQPRELNVVILEFVKIPDLPELCLRIHGNLRIFNPAQQRSTNESSVSIFFVICETDFKGEPKDGRQEFTLLMGRDNSCEAAFMMDLVYFRNQKRCLVAENVVNNVWLITVVNTRTMSHILSCWEHFICQIK
jgi:hypothetical protein